MILAFGDGEITDAALAEALADLRRRAEYDPAFKRAYRQALIDAGATLPDWLQDS